MRCYFLTRKHSDNCHCCVCKIKRGEMQNPFSTDRLKEMSRKRMICNNPMFNKEIVKKNLDTKRKNGTLHCNNLQNFKSKYGNSILYLKQKNKGVYNEICHTISTRMTKDNPMKNVDVAKKVSITMKEKINSGEIVPYMCTQEGRDRISVIAKKRALEHNPMKNPEIMKRAFAEFKKGKISSYENKFKIFIEKFSLPIEYTGLGTLWIGYPPRNPDFRVIDKKKCIEVACSTYPFRNTNNYEQERKNIFKKYGWQCLVLFLDKEESENTLLEKVKNFCD